MKEGTTVKTDSETKEKLLASAKAEFMEKGYTKASLRKICANAGLTTGALYFFFNDKEDLFASVVGEPLKELMELLQVHFMEDEQTYSAKAFEYQNGEHDEIATLLIHHLYTHYDEFLLLLTKSQGTNFENKVDELVDMIDASYMMMAESLMQQRPGMMVNSYMVHWMSHMATDAFIHLLTHEPDEGKALQHTKEIIDYIAEGWMKMILIPTDGEESSQ